MGYEQIDGVKNILVNEKGFVRQGLRTLSWDDDRFEYQYDDNGQKKNEWPLVVVDIDEDGTEDKRLLPALVLKEHGKLPRQLPVSAKDFKAKNGKKLPPNCHIDNIEYVGDGKFEGQKPYAEPPEKTKKDEEPEGQQVQHKTADKGAPESSGIPDDLEKATNEKVADTADLEEDAEGEAADDAPKEGKPEVSSGQGPEPEPSDLMKGSGALKAKRAIEIISNFEYDELEDVGFYTEDARDKGVRVTVKEAWEAKKKSS